MKSKSWRKTQTREKEVQEEEDVAARRSSETQRQRRAETSDSPDETGTEEQRRAPRGLVSLSLLLGSSRSCFQCFVETQVHDDLCWGYITFEHGPEERSVPECNKRLDRWFNKNSTVIEAARVGAGYDQQLKDIMNAEILPIRQVFHQMLQYDFEYDARLQPASDRFVAAASQLPRGTTCFPPCGFQSEGAYDCEICQYDSCEFPLDCPVKEIKVMEHSGVRMECKVPFELPTDFLAVWRFAEEVRTRKVDDFKEVTAGEDMLFSIPSSTSEHEGTYQCEIYSEQRSIVRLYFHLEVTPQVEDGHTELQETFDLSLLPGGSLLPVDDTSSHSRPSAVLLVACVGAAGLLLLLSLGTLVWVAVPGVRPTVEELQNMLQTGAAGVTSS